MRGPLLVITLPVGGIGPAGLSSLGDACEGVAENKAIRSVVVRSADGSFAGGPDGAAASPDPFGCLATLAKPTIVAVDGPCSGLGLGLALACDIRIAGSSATFQVSGPESGRLPPAGVLQRLVRLAGRGNTLYLALIGQMVGAEDALRVGLVSEVVPDPVDRALEVASRIAERGPLALQYAKEAVSRGMDMTLEQALRFETDLTIILQTTEDREEGVRAFLDKRNPQFEGQ